MKQQTKAGMTCTGRSYASRGKGGRMTIHAKKPVALTIEQAFEKIRREDANLLKRLAE